MTTAHPQPVATSAESSDDLIAELARLMAQDVPAARPTPPATASSEPRPTPSPSVRIPGAPADPAPQAARPAGGFDFNFGVTPASKAPSRVPAQAAPASSEPLVRVPSFAASTAKPTPPPSPEPEPPAAAEVDDPIAALIAAELDSTFARPAPPPVAQAPVPVIRAEPVLRTEAPQPQSALPAPARRPEEPDRFATAPVFGIASRPAAPPAPADDPMSEIEGLIGQAVRVELAAAPQRAEPRLESQPRVVEAAEFIDDEEPEPAVPVRAPLPTSADDTILAAAAATGSDVDMVDEPMFGPTARERGSRLGLPKVSVPKVSVPKLGLPKLARRRPVQAEAEDVEPRRRRGLARPLVGFAAAAALLVVTGAGLWAVLGLNQPAGEAPVLTADAAPVKEPAPVAEATPAAAERSLVLDGMASPAGDAAVADDEQLVSRDQADGSEITEVAAVADAEGDGDATLASRKVRTITVRPDGSIVNGDAALAGAEVLPVERPNVPDLPAPDAVAQEMLAAVRPPVIAPAPAPMALADTTQAALVAPAANLAGPPTTVAMTDDGVEVPYPMPRPLGREYVAAAAPAAAPLAPVNAVVSDDSPVGAVNLMGDAEPKAEPTPRTAAVESKPAVTNSNIAVAYVQLSSQRSEEAARSSAATISGRFGSLFGGKSLEIQRVDLGEKGIFFRVRLPAGSLNEAANICANVKANGGDCFALNG